MRTSRLLCAIYALCMLFGATTHWTALVTLGVAYYGGVPVVTRVFWASLAILDPLAALLLFAKPRAALVLTLAIIVSDVLHNTWVEWYLGLPAQAFLNWMYELQILFLFLVVSTIKVAWRGLD